MEVRRFGGSSGKTKNTKELHQYHDSQPFPRKPEGVKHFQSECSWSAVYIKTQKVSRQAAYFSYSQPQIGGQFKMPAGLIKQEKVLQRFTLFKIHSAHILQAVDPLISPGAVMSQMEENRLAQEGSNCMHDMIYKVSMSNHHTLVQHPVGYHFDKFHGNKPKLENRMCFIDSEVDDDVGRGGAGPSKFVWALTDW